MDKIDAFPFNLPFDENPSSEPADLRFRNYFPTDEKFNQYRFDKVRKGDDIEEEWKEKVDEIVTEYHESESQPLNILPKKANLDLKRMLDRKMDKLNRRTEIAIVHLIRDRLRSQNEEQNGSKTEATNEKETKERKEKESRDSTKGKDFESKLDEKGEIIDTIEEDEGEAQYANLAEKLSKATEKGQQLSDDEDDDLQILVHTDELWDHHLGVFFSGVSAKQTHVGVERDYWSRDFM